jgi:hypothetical protein
MWALKLSHTPASAFPCKQSLIASLVSGHRSLEEGAVQEEHRKASIENLLLSVIAVDD